MLRVRVAESELLEDWVGLLLFIAVLVEDTEAVGLAVFDTVELRLNT